MTDQAPEPRLLERGRYAVSAMPDGGYTVTRAVNICDRCLSCGCGEQAPPLEAPGFALKMLQRLGPGGLQALTGRVFRRGGGELEPAAGDE